jgi:hypothetical protein
MRKPTPVQAELLEILKKYMTKVSPMKYESLKALSEFKSFDSSFNALLDKGHVKHYQLGQGENTFILA